MSIINEQQFLELSDMVQGEFIEEHVLTDEIHFIDMREYTTTWQGLGKGIEHANENGIFVQLTSDWDDSGWVTLVGATGGNSPPDGFQATHIRYKSLFLAFWIAYMKALGVLE